MPTFLTVRDVAERVRRPDEDIDAVMFRLKNWTKEGLLRPHGKRSPGTGVPHSYTQEAVTDALLLTALGDWGIPAVRSAALRDAKLARTLFLFGRLAVAAARKQPGKVVWLGMGREAGKAHGWPQIWFPGKEPEGGADHFESVITLNITQLLLQTQERR